VPTITASNARELAARGHQAKRIKRVQELARLALVDSLLSKAVESTPIASPASPQPAMPAVVASQLTIVEQQIASTRTILDDPNVDYCPACERGGIPAHHRAQLLRALDQLLDRQRKLLGIPDPGHLRPSAPRETGRRRGPELEVLPLPLALPAAPIPELTAASPCHATQGPTLGTPSSSP